MRGFAEDVRIAARFLADAPRFLRRPFDLVEGRATLDGRFRHRAQNFLDLAAVAAASRSSPYGRLFAEARCELDDVRRLVAEDGVEGALSVLLRAGVYLTVEEFKGRRPVVRGSASFDVRPADLVNPVSVVHGVNQTGGSRGPRTLVPIDLAFVRDHAINTHLTLDAHGGYRWTHAHWGVPGGTALTNMLELAKGGNPPARWFTPIDPAARELHPRYRLGTRALALVGRAAGCPLPRAEHVPLDDALPIAHWMASVLRRGDTPHVWTFASSAVRVAQAAVAAGLDLTGARFTAGGEPTTAARLASVRAAGAEALPRFGTTETDIFAYACRAPDFPDDMHLLDDRHAVVQAGAAVETLPPRALLVSSLLASAPLVLLNLSLGDQAELVERECGCPLEALGWRRHIHTARSFEKLTAGGITFLDVDVASVLEIELPERFGGGPTDYQLLEDERADGRPSITLLVDPRIGPLDDRDVVEAFLGAIGHGREGELMAAVSWREGGVVEVERRSPVRTPSGKILHLHRGERSSLG